ncbi:ParB N-terminal domain-containing protein [Labrenzia sp. OB1]|uniref:ParB/RepB/Spo0J family partition protein n=1 Tax=Labrenzia sp. OB1 TaxID=1561204 RepID=UPI0007B2B6D5|nr:ParB N-terminal domain-containing protein [Labrenzia sp. OB1]KZM49565.1 chromosome partitioning protein ParB [Labrenzia sp. OB1]
MSAYSSIKVSLIDIPDGRLRGVDPDWAECLSAMFRETGQKTPIDVVANGKRFSLVAGAHRLEAAKRAKWREIEARILEPSAEHAADELRLHEILENLGRKDLNALERCEALSELKRVYEALHPQTKRGGDRKSQAARNKKENQTEIVSFCFSAAETTGLTDRAIRMAIAIFNGLSPETRERLKGSVFAEKQSDLKALADLDAEVQAKVLDLILGELPKARTIADALLILDGRDPETATDRVLRSACDNLSKLPRAGRMVVFKLHRKEIVELVRREGWLDE